MAIPAVGEAWRTEAHVCPPSCETIATPDPSAITVFDPFVIRRGELPRMPCVRTVGEGDGTGLGLGSTTPLLWWWSGVSDVGLEAIATPTPMTSPTRRTPATQAAARAFMSGEV
jgi:hypothetical protein